MSTFFRVLSLILLAGISTAPAIAQQNRGHGSIYYSPSGHRIGWARSLSDDSNADHVASAMCQGGQIDSFSLNAYSGSQGGVSATGTGPDLTSPLSDCFKVIKFDSAANHQCGGFGFNADGRFSKGVRESNKGSVQDDLSSWQQQFVVCNDDASVSGFDKFVGALDALSKAFGGRSHETNNGNSGYNPGNVQGTGGTSISFTNTTTVAVSLGLKCANEQSYHAVQIPVGATQTYDASSWGSSCGSYTVQITTTNNDGSQTQNQHTVNAGGPYAIVYNGDSLDLRSAPVAPAPALVVFNDTAQPVNFTVSCPNLKPTNLTVAANSSSSHVLHCSEGAMLTLSTGTSANSTTKLYPVVNGRTYHIRTDPNLNVFTLVAQ